MNVIFLDIDGVLNTTVSKTNVYGSVGIDKHLVAKLKTIIDQTKAVVVLTSTWKSDYEIFDPKSTSVGRYMYNKLYGIPIIDKTKDNDTNRGYGIHNWLKNKKHIENFVILDDIYFNDYNEYNLTPYVVQTDERYGITDKNITQGIDILNRKSG